MNSREVVAAWAIVSVEAVGVIFKSVALCSGFCSQALVKIVKCRIEINAKQTVSCT